MIVCQRGKWLTSIISALDTVNCDILATLNFGGLGDKTIGEIIIKVFF